jgi:hypothetical protein
VPNVDHLASYFIDDPARGSVVYLKPKGIDDSPRRAQEVLEAVTCVLQALEVFLHARTEVTHNLMDLIGYACWSETTVPS